MRRIYLAILPAALFLSCELLEDKPVVVDSTATIAPKKELDESVPHPVMYGDSAKWGFMPDSSIDDVVLANAESFGKFWKEHGANMKKLDGKRQVACYFNSQSTEWLAVYLTQNAKGKELPYALVLQKAGAPGSPPMPNPKNPEYVSHANLITAHGIYIGMSPEYVMRIYSHQEMMEWTSGDTTYLEYRPKEKDAKHYHRSDWKNNRALYKFVEGKLRRAEYSTDPAELESR